MKIIQATLEHLDDLVPLFEAYRVWYKKPANELKTRQFLTERILKHESIIFSFILMVHPETVGRGVLVLVLRNCIRLLALFV